MTKEWLIRDIENITEEQARKMADDTREIKGHNIYFIDFGGYFGFSYVVFKNEHHIHYANDYELHHKGKSRMELKMLYVDKINKILFTEEEIVEPIKDYNEYKNKEYFLRNYYGMQVDSVSIFCCNPTEEQRREFKRKTKKMVYNPVAFAYMSDADFVEHHVKLLLALEKAKDNMSSDYEYLKKAYLHEMYNHEYGINWQADYDTLSAFGNIGYHGDNLNAYFEELKFTDLQKQAYLDARRQYFKESEL